MTDIGTNMKPISVAVSEEDYREFQRAARKRGRPVAELIREAMAFYRAEKLESREPLRDLPVVVGSRPKAKLPSRAALYDEIFPRPANR